MSRDLSIGMTGKDVEALQRFLNHHLGIPLQPLVPDGIFGTETRNRVIEFQKRNKMLPRQLPYPDNYPGEFREPLKIDGIVGEHTLRVLIDLRTVNTIKDDGGASFAPTDQQRIPILGFALNDPVGDPPAPPTPPTPTPAKTFRFVQLQSGTSANVNPWSISPFVFTAQAVFLAKNEGKPDFMLTAGAQVSLNDDRPGGNGRWSGQGFLQMGVGADVTVNLLGKKLDLLNPFVQLMINRNLANNLKGDGPPTFGMAVGNQISWKLVERLLPGETKEKQDTVSIFFNGQAVTNVNLNNGQCAGPPGGQAMIGATYTFF